jgi:hypothetical protein
VEYTQQKHTNRKKANTCCKRNGTEYGQHRLMVSVEEILSCASVIKKFLLMTAYRQHYAKDKTDQHCE